MAKIKYCLLMPKKSGVRGRKKRGTEMIRSAGINLMITDAILSMIVRIEIILWSYDLIVNIAIFGGGIVDA